MSATLPRTIRFHGSNRREHVDLEPGVAAGDLLRALDLHPKLFHVHKPGSKAVMSSEADLYRAILESRTHSHDPIYISPVMDAGQARTDE